MKNLPLFISCSPGIEHLLAEELEQFGISSKPGRSGVYIPCTIQNVYTVNYASRIATRVLWPLIQFPCKDKDDLYKNTLAFDWSPYITPEQTLAIDANVSHPALKNSHFAGLVIKDAICDQLREKTGSRPSVDLKAPDLQLNLFVTPYAATLNIDASGPPLYKRGYRSSGTEAPIQESLAAAVLSAAQLSPDDIICDPFCGSGTLLIESAMILSRTPAGYFRRAWAHNNLPEFSVDDWGKAKQHFNAQIQKLPTHQLFGCDLSHEAIASFQKQLKLTGYPIEAAHCPLQTYTPPKTPTLIITNPPYGRRIQTSEATYKALGAFVKTHAPNARVVVLCPDDNLMRSTGLRLRKHLTIHSGGLDVNVYTK